VGRLRSTLTAALVAAIAMPRWPETVQEGVQADLQTLQEGVQADLQTLQEEVQEGPEKVHQGLPGKVQLVRLCTSASTTPTT